MSSNLKKVLSDVEISLKEASGHYEIWWALGYTENRKKFRGVFEHNDYNHVLHTSYIANQMAMFMALARLFDRDPRASSMSVLRRSLSDNGFDSLSQLICHELQAYKTLVKKILDVRSKLVAHKDSSYTDSEVLSENGITPKEIRDLLKSCTGLLVQVACKLRTFNVAYTTGFHEQSTLNVLEGLEGITKTSS
ncbi:hypothetical protein [Vibrio alginolyticus]|uniref:AbiU2 domain-containing protein n=1 Tax=Vibrio alginolyticus TaxID=663 RepID=UPI00148DD883|nr:hypothetical protein [Vibrio alginolyticus]NOI46175.1 hypothetical protein [Vibrio alginolyticus]